MTAPKPALRHHPAVPWLIAATAVLVRAVVSWTTCRTAEDALITLRYAENLAAGRGFAYNVGEHVLGTTTPLYTLVLAGAAWLFGPGGPALACGKTLNIVADGSTCLLLCAWLRKLGRPGVGLLAAALYAVDARAINWCSSGMETGLVTLAGMAAITAFAHQRMQWCAAAVGLLLLLRPDGLLLAGILLIAWMIAQRRVPWRPILIVLAIVLPWLAFATAYFGSPAPTSIQAKLVIYPRFAVGTLPQLGAFARQTAGSAPGLLLAGCFSFGVALVVRRERRILAPTVWATAYLAMFATSKLILFGWYLVPALPVYLAVAALVTTARGKWAARGGAAAGGLALIWSAAMLPALQRHLATVQAHEDAQRRTIGRWIDANTPRGDTLMVESIGYIGYHSRRPILDAAGLVSPQVLLSYRREVDCPLLDIVRRFRPPSVLLYVDEYDWVCHAAVQEGYPLGGAYTVEHRWDAPPGDLAGRGLVLLRRAGHGIPVTAD